jgi:hypothetical protein
MRRIFMDANQMFLGGLAGFTAYLMLGLANGFHSIYPYYLLYCGGMGMLGSLIPTLWETLTSSKEMARISHSWLVVLILLGITHINQDPLLDSICFGYLVHLFLDAQTKKLAPALQLKSCNRTLGYTIIILTYLVMIACILYSWQHRTR